MCQLPTSRKDNNLTNQNKTIININDEFINMNMYQSGTMNRVKVSVGLLSIHLNSSIECKQSNTVTHPVPVLTQLYKQNPGVTGRPNTKLEQQDKE